MPGLLSYFRTDERELGLLFAWVTVGGALAVVAGGWLSDVAGSRLTVGAGLGVAVCAFASFGQARSLAVAQVQLLAMGLGSGLIQAGTIAVCARAGGHRGRALMNLSQSFYGLGAVAGPLLVGAVLVSGLGWQAAYRAAAALAVVCAAAALLMPRAPAAAAVGAARERPRLRLLARRLLWTMAALGALYVTIEAGVGEWTSELLVQRFGSPAGAAALAVSLFWAGIAGGKVVVGLLFHRAPPQRVILVASLLVPPAMLAFALTPWLPLQYLLIVAVGLALAPIFSTLLAWGGGLSPRSEGFVTGFLAAVSVGGASVLRPAMTTLSASKGLTAGFLFFFVLSLLMAALAILLSARPPRPRAPSAGP